MSKNTEVHKLAPCPFCGSSKIEIERVITMSWVACRDCQAIGPARKTAHEAVDGWNTRAEISWSNTEDLS